MAVGDGVSGCVCVEKLDALRVVDDVPESHPLALGLAPLEREGDGEPETVELSEVVIDGVGDGDAVGDGVDAEEPDCERLAVDELEIVPVCVADSLADAVSGGVGAPDGDAVSVGEADAEGVALGDGLGDGVDAGVAESESVGDGEGVAVPDSEGSAADADAVGETVGEGDAVVDGDGVFVGETELVCDGDPVALSVGV